MQIGILYRPAHALAQVQMGAGEAVQAESGAMVGMSADVNMTTDAGGFKKGLKRLLGGESFFRNTFTAPREGGEVLLAPPLCGDMVVLPVGGAPLDGVVVGEELGRAAAGSGRGGWFVQASAYVASTLGVNIDSKLGGFKGFFSGAGAFVLKAEGQGQVIIGGFGALEEVEVKGVLIVDTGHLAAWEVREDLNYKITKATKGWISSFLSGEGLVCRFEGQGKVWIQTRNSPSFGKMLGGLLPPKKG
jgi:uncharacterized protein (AIM24 family)